METANPHIKSLIKLVHEYFARKTDKNLSQLHLHLQILSVCDISAFEVRCMETNEFFVCLGKLLTESDSKSSLPWKVISLLLHISRSPSMQISLRDDFMYVPIICNFLSCTSSKDKSLKTLQLLQMLTYGIEIQRRESWLLKLVPTLVSIIMDSQAMDDTREPAIAILGNICRGNEHTVSFLCECSERKVLSKCLINARTQNNRIRLLISELLIYLNVNYSLMEEETIRDILDMIFVVAIEGISEEESDKLLLAKDILKEIAGRGFLDVVKNSYSKFNKNISDLLDCISSSHDPHCVAVAFQLIEILLHLEALDLPENLVIEKVLLWIPDPRIGITGHKMLQFLVTLSSDSILTSHADDIVQCLKASLAKSESIEKYSDLLHWSSSLLILFNYLVSRHSAVLCHKLANSLRPPTISSFLQTFIKVDPVDDPQQMDVSPSSSSGYNSLPSRNCQNSLPINQNWLQKEAEIVVRTLSAISQLVTINPEFEVEIHEIFGNPKVITHIAACERSGDRELIFMATSLFREEFIPREKMNDLVEARFNLNLNDKHSSFDDKSTISPFYQLPSIRSSEQIDQTLDKLRTTVDKSEVKDVPLISVMEFYEYKIASMTHSEKCLQKSLSASDDHLRETKLTLLRSQSENAHLRSLLHSWEQRILHSQTEKRELDGLVCELKTQAKNQRETLMKEKIQLERQGAKIKNDLQAARNLLESREEDNRRLQRSLNEATSEAKSLHNVIKHEKEEKTKLNEACSKLEEEVRKNKRSFEDFEKEISRMEKVHARLKKEKTDLELLIKTQEESLMEKESQNEVLKTENESLKKIRDMIHNISAGRMK